MDELDLFRDFRCGVAAPSGDARRRASALLAHAVDGEQTPGTSALRRIGKRPRYLALALVALAGATAKALLVSTPWSDAPGFLERAQAGLTPPAGTILHQKWEDTATLMTDPACTVTLGPNEIWIDQTPPHRYRALLSDLGDPLCSSGTASELGGTLDTQETLLFVPPNTLTNTAEFNVPPDPVKDLREAISAGIAHDEGTTQLDGRTVRRIRIDPLPSDCPDPCPREPSYAYVDPQTFYPVQREGPWYMIRNDELTARFHAVSRFVTFEYLPRTAANLALTDIQAQHPDATP